MSTCVYLRPWPTRKYLCSCGYLYPRVQVSVPMGATPDTGVDFEGTSTCSHGYRYSYEYNCGMPCCDSIVYIKEGVSVVLRRSRLESLWVYCETSNV